MITALYDCRSKQEYIYRTNKVREISGASQLLTHLYERMMDTAHKHGISIQRSWRDDYKKGKKFDLHEFEQSSDDGTVIYEGGGSLYVLYKDKSTYIRVNQIFSRMLLEETYSVSIIAAAVETTESFSRDREELYKTKTRTKNLGTHSAFCNVLPFTQIDRMTFMPVVSKTEKNDKTSYEDKTAEMLCKQKAYSQYCKDPEEHHTDRLDDLIWKKGEDSLLAVIYIDGNAMGKKLIKSTEGLADYTRCVEALRRFSIQTNDCFVEQPLEAIRKCLQSKNEDDAELIAKGTRKEHRYRRIISGGDEITVICRASDAADIVKAYFAALAKTEPLVPGSRNASCAGIALFHSHAPFADVYEIAEACCESGKKKTRESESEVSYIDFHYCHAGITNELDVLREEQEKDCTARPYSVEEFDAFCELMTILRNNNNIGRSNVKSLGEAIIKSEAAYRFETERICSRDKDGKFTKMLRDQNTDQQQLKKRLYDASVIFDLWAGKESV